MPHFTPVKLTVFHPDPATAGGRSIIIKSKNEIFNGTPQFYTDFV